MATFIRRPWRSLVFVSLAVLLALPLFASQPTPAGAANRDDVDMLTLINAERAAAQLPALAPYWDLEDDASRQTNRQMVQGSIFHTVDLRSVTDGWAALGENVGMGPTTNQLHDAFMASPGHRGNILGDWTHAGVSSKRAENGQLFVTVIFMKAATPIAHAEPLTDLPRLAMVPGDAADSIFADDIGWLVANGAALGCSSTAYCPDRPLTRGEMASVLVWALDLPASGTDFFGDDDGSPHEADINALAQARITLGCNPPTNDRFCPAETVTRAQMASFFVRAFDLPAGADDLFGDDAASVHQADINALATSGITRGCNPPANDRFCPDNRLTRGQIAAFIARALR